MYVSIVNSLVKHVTQYIASHAIQMRKTHVLDVEKEIAITQNNI